MAAAVAENHTSRLHFALLAEPLIEKGFCIVESAVTDNWLLCRVGSVKLPKVNENVT